MQLRVYAFEGTLTPIELASRPLGPPLLELARDEANVGTLQLPGSFAVVPKPGRRSDAVTLWMRVQVGGTPTAPATAFDRVVRFSYAPRQPLFSRVFLNSGCADQAVGCFRVPDSECTVAQVCAEIGATCGDDGECVLPEITTVPDDRDAAAPIDVAAPPRADVVLQRTDTGVVPDVPNVDVPEPIDRFTPNDTSTDAFDAAADSDVADVVDVVDSVDVPDPIAPPRPLRPLGTSTVTTRRPTLYWQYPSGTTGAVIQLCRDTQFSNGCAPELSIASTSISLAVPLAPGQWFWRLIGTRGGTRGQMTSPTWSFNVRSVDTAANTSHGVVLDVNGDGFADHAVGSSNATIAGQIQAGRAAVFYGSAMGLPMNAQWTANGTNANDRFATSLAAAGDINGDGYSELLVGAINATAPGAPASSGTVSIYFGSPMGLEPMPRTVLAGLATGSHFGASVAGVGDVNGDGYADIAVGATEGGAASEGQVRVYLGNETGRNLQLNVALTGTRTGDQFGTSVAGAGDLNDDGFHDIAVGAVQAQLGAVARTGTVSVYYASSRALGITPVAAAVVDGAVGANSNFGWSVSMDGDLNGDGLADVAMGGIYSTEGGVSQSGRTALYLGNRVSFPVMPSSIFAGQNGDLAGYSLSTQGDFNGDGYGDLVVSSVSERVTVAGRGALRIYPGGPVGPSVMNVARFTIGGSAQYAIRVSTRGDINGDGLSDLIVGGNVNTQNLADGGQIHVYHGRMDLMQTMPTSVIIEPLTNFGSSLCELPPQRGLRLPRPSTTRQKPRDRLFVLGMRPTLSKRRQLSGERF